MKSQPQSLIQIVPSLPPAIDGIGDYALQLARQLRANWGIESSFIVCDPAWARAQWTGEFQAVGLEKRTGALMRQAVDLITSHVRALDSPILLHFSPYGYETRGCPLWLVHSLEALQKNTPGRINIAFHELEVHSSKLLSSARWVPGLQRLLIRRLLNIAAFMYTNTKLHQSKLDAWGRTKVSFIPNFSNIGELATAPPTQGRSRVVVIFGRADQRRWTYEHGGDALSKVCHHIAADRIIDIGAPIAEHTVAHLHGVPIERRGVLPADEVADTMRGALASFMYYPIPLLTKSGVHALTCASGALPFVCNDVAAESTCGGLVAGVDYIAVEASESLPPLHVLESLSPAIYASYSRRSSNVAAQTIAAQLASQSRIGHHAASVPQNDTAVNQFVEGTKASSKLFSEREGQEVAQ